MSLQRNSRGAPPSAPEFVFSKPKPRQRTKTTLFAGVVLLLPGMLYLAFENTQAVAAVSSASVGSTDQAAQVNHQLRPAAVAAVAQARAPPPQQQAPTATKGFAHEPSAAARASQLPAPRAALQMPSLKRRIQTAATMKRQHAQTDTADSTHC